jgi:outer membrane lipoprotein SlyB
MEKKLFLLGAIALMALSLSGCCPKVMTIKVYSEPDRYEHIRELEMQNAALKAANQYLINGR